MQQIDHYEVLRVPRNASAEVIQAAYRTLMVACRMHPDLGGDEAAAIRINLAYEVLSDPKKRGDYDREIAMLKPSTLQQQSVERRRAERVATDVSVSFCLSHDVRWYTARLRDVSTIGVRMCTDFPLGSEQRVSIAASNPAAALISGTVRWSRLTHPNIFTRLYEVGIEFDVPISDIRASFEI